MNVWVAALVMCLAITAPAGAAESVQPLSIAIHGDSAQATRLPEYDPRIPIAVRVVDTDRPAIAALTIVATGPGGQSIRTALTPEADGAYSGSLSLADPGSWSLRLTSRSGPLSTDTTPVALNVQAPPPSNAPAIGFAVGCAIFIVVGGGGFLLIRRVVAPRPSDRLEPAA